MRLYLFLLCVLWVPGISHADTNWWRVSANTALIADMAQTVEIAKNPDYYETNWALNREPSVDEVYKFFLVKALLMNIAGANLPEKYRDYLYIAMTGLHTEAVLSNYAIGIRMRF